MARTQRTRGVIHGKLSLVAWSAFGLRRGGCNAGFSVEFRETASNEFIELPM